MRALPEPDISTTTFAQRLKILPLIFCLLLLCLVLRLSYWQIVKGAQLRAEGAQQYQRQIINQGQRGRILTSDGFTLVDNQVVYNLIGQPQLLKQSPDQISRQLLPLLTPYVLNDLNRPINNSATDSATVITRTVTPNMVTDALANLQTALTAKLAKSDSRWSPLYKNLSDSDMIAVKNLNLDGITFEKAEKRAYPEASLAAQVVGFVGQNNDGTPTGYFGIEGALDKEMAGKNERVLVETDAVGGRMSGEESGDTQGRDVVLTIRRDLQYAVESMLSAGMAKYQAKAGEVIVMEPTTGKILAMAASPNYNPDQYSEYQPELYKNPSVSDGYEPGSTFKTLTVAAGIDANVINEQTQCTKCSAPRVIGQYTLRTWNDVYNPNITMTDALAKSDNTAMIFVAEQLGADKFQEYLKKFGIGQPTQVELQEDATPPFPTKWGPVELATRSFGQGISVTSLQLLKAVNAIANQGKVMRPIIVDKVIDHATNQEITTQPIQENQAISADTARRVSQMMVYAAQHGEAQWTASHTHTVAAKTGTAQVAVNGKYDPTKTIASFIGFTPADNPKFVMIVKLIEPQTSPWAAETAAPLWYKIAEKLYLLMGIPPDMSPETIPNLLGTLGTSSPAGTATPTATAAKPEVGD